MGEKFIKKEIRKESNKFSFVWEGVSQKWFFFCFLFLFFLQIFGPFGIFLLVFHSIVSWTFFANFLRVSQIFFFFKFYSGGGWVSPKLNLFFLHFFFLNLSLGQKFWLRIQNRCWDSQWEDCQILGKSHFPISVCEWATGSLSQDDQFKKCSIAHLKTHNQCK